MFCKKCGKGLNPDTVYCPNCGERVEERSAFEPYGQSYEYKSARQYHQNYDSQYYARSELSTANTLGIVSIIVGALAMNLIGWICGGIGLSKANRYIYSTDPSIQFAARRAKKLNTIGLIVTSVIFALVVLCFSIIFYILGFVIN